jgi:hypothetical protein
MAVAVLMLQLVIHVTATLDTQVTTASTSFRNVQQKKMTATRSMVFA